MNAANRRKSTSTVGITGRKDATRMKIEQMEKERKERRKTMMQRKEARKQEHMKNIEAGNPGDVDFIGLVEEWRREQENKIGDKSPPSLFASTNSNICIAVRKRPISDKERQKLDHDSVSCFQNKVWIHSAKLKVDGITKYLTHNSFQLDHTFGEDSTTEQIYLATTLPLVDHVVSTQGRATVFCYGQTGSGKTYTMNGIQQILAYDLYGQLAEHTDDLEITVAFFELYSGNVLDLLHGCQRCKLLEDGNGEVNITGLREVPAPTPEAFLQVIEEGHSLRTTQKTEANDASSRSHAICQVFLRDYGGNLRGKLGLVDLAGSERGSDTKQHNSQRRTESADINTSLLALKECIRALGQKSAHVPYRGSKLTLILKDCFSPDSKTTMVATVSPGASAADHSLNTLRYADRIKEQRVSSNGQRGKAAKASNREIMPSKERLMRIAAATEQADDQHSAFVQKMLAEHDQVQADANDYAFTEQVDEEEADDEEGDYEEESEDLDYEDSEGQDYEEAVESQYDHSQEAQEGEEELRRTVQAVFELEEALLNQHMSNIQANAEMLTQEGKLLQSVQAGGLSEDEMHNYAIQLAEFLDKKESLIYKLQSKLDEFQEQLAREQELARQVQLTQY
uniref:Diatom spindle kinesin-1 n=1 Tax=Cylindrotheca fusiformis TaxID=2853 RepID=DSK1_CYLFU|nr:RecName: Full=Diatom spindle kinesin-1 [Cylindrotheca fusiformis]AAB05681.1 diatom spindle kinesin 1 [Cylindrotheca fusiformis]